jgi:hypothetical protein
MADVSRIKLPDGNTYNIKDTVSGYVTGMTTTAGSHIAGAQTVTSGIITTNIPTKTSHLTNDSGFITTDSDEKLKTTSLSTGTTSYLLSGPAETTAANKYYVPDITAYRNSGGPTYLTVGSASGAYAGGLGLANNGTSKGQTIINPSATSNIILTLPDATGTIALTSDIPSIPTVPTITLNGTATTSPSFYAPTTAGTSGYVLKSNGSGAPTWAQVQTGGVTDVTVGGTSVVTSGVAAIASPAQIVRW